MIGIGPKAVNPLDVIFIFYGGKVPLAIRQNGQAYELVGECYIRDLMHGEVVEPGGGNSESWVELI